jgi:hypothetical protein
VDRQRAGAGVRLVRRGCSKRLSTCTPRVGEGSVDLEVLSRPESMGSSWPYGVVRATRARSSRFVLAMFAWMKRRPMIQQTAKANGSRTARRMTVIVQILLTWCGYRTLRRDGQVYMPIRRCLSSVFLDSSCFVGLSNISMGNGKSGAAGPKKRGRHKEGIAASGFRSYNSTP